MLGIDTLSAGDALLGAIIAGTQAGATDTVKMGVTALVERIKGIFGDDSAAVSDLDVYARMGIPALAESVREHLATHGVIDEESLVEWARELLHEAGPAALGAGAVAAGVINQNVSGGSAFMGGAHTINNYAPQPGAPLVPSWRLEHYSGDTYLLENTGPGTAYDVVLDMPDVPRFDGPDNASSVWEPGEGHTFMAALSLGCGRDLVVRYALTEGGPSKTWRRPLPPKPGR